MTRPLPRRTLLALPLLGALAACTSADAAVAFPDLTGRALIDRQRALVRLLRTEHAAQPGPTRYTPVDGEPWCADFVSLVEREVGTPLRNPTSGGWRIPGTMTLREHLRDTGAWHPAGDGYVPVTGDIAVYDGGPFGQHTNYVLDLADGILTTVGGNEFGVIRVSKHPLDRSLHHLGFGHRA